MDNARLFSHFACGWHPETLLLARPVSQFTRKVSHLCPESPYQIRLSGVYKRRQTYYKPRARGGTRPARCYASAGGGKTGASRLDGPQTPSGCRGLSGSPARRAIGALPPPYGRRFPCASIRARRGARETRSAIDRYGLQRRGFVELLIWASRIAARQAEGNRRGEPVGGCGTPASDAGRRCPRPKWGGQRNRPRADASAPRAVAYRPSIPRHARVLTRPSPVPCRFPLCRNHVGLLSEIHVGQEGAWRFSAATQTCERHGEL